MPRTGWTAIATPSGLCDVVRGPRPPSVQWPVSSKGKGTKGQGEGKGNPKPVAAVAAPQKVQGNSKVARLEAALQAFGQEQSSARLAVEKALKTVKEEPETSAPGATDCRSGSASAKIGFCSDSVGRERPRCGTIENRPQTGTEPGTSAPRGRAFPTARKEIQSPSWNCLILASNFFRETVPPRGGLQNNILGKTNNNFQPLTALVSLLVSTPAKIS